MVCYFTTLHYLIYDFICHYLNYLLTLISFFYTTGSTLSTLVMIIVCFKSFPDFQSIKIQYLQDSCHEC